MTAARWLWMPLLAYGITRLGIALVVDLAVHLIADSSPPPYHLRLPDSVLLDVWQSMARWGGNQWVDRAVTALSLLGLGLFTAMFANGYWVG